MKAVLFFRLSQFVYWPGQNGAPKPTVFCVAGDDNPFGGALAQIDKGNPSIEMRTTSGDLAGCHLLFIPRAEAAALPGWLARNRQPAGADGFRHRRLCPQRRHGRTTARRQPHRHRRQPARRPRPRFRIQRPVAAPGAGGRTMTRQSLNRLLPAPTIRNKLVALFLRLPAVRRRSRLPSRLHPAAPATAGAMERFDDRAVPPAGQQPAGGGRLRRSPRGDAATRLAGGQPGNPRRPPGPPRRPAARRIPGGQPRHPGLPGNR